MRNSQDLGVFVGQSCATVVVEASTSMTTALGMHGWADSAQVPTGVTVILRPLPVTAQT